MHMNMAFYLVLVIVILTAISCLGINTVLDEIAALSYPAWLTDAIPFLPKLDLACIAHSGMSYLDDAAGNSTLATITGFLDEIMVGCSSDSFLLSGGYDNAEHELKMNIVFEANASGSL